MQITYGGDFFTHTVRVSATLMLNISESKR